MRTGIAAVTALAGSLLLAPLMLGPSQAESATDFKNALSAIHDGGLTLVRGREIELASEPRAHGVLVVRGDAEGSLIQKRAHMRGNSGEVTLKMGARHLIDDGPPRIATAA